MDFESLLKRVLKLETDIDWLLGSGRFTKEEADYILVTYRSELLGN